VDLADEHCSDGRVDDRRRRRLVVVLSAFIAAAELSVTAPNHRPVTTTQTSADQRPPARA